MNPSKAKLKNMVRLVGIGMVAAVIVLMIVPSAFAQSSRYLAIQLCIAQAQAQWGTSFNRARTRERSYAACMHRKGFRP